MGKGPKCKNHGLDAEGEELSDGHEKNMFRHFKVFGVLLTFALVTEAQDCSYWLHKVDPTVAPASRARQ